MSDTPQNPSPQLEDSSSEALPANSPSLDSPNSKVEASPRPDVLPEFKPQLSAVPYIKSRTAPPASKVDKPENNSSE